jgi:tetratricopeptide (TPR) repeat protein
MEMVKPKKALAIGYILLLVPAALLNSCYAPSVIQNTIVTYPPHQMVPGPGKLFVANGYDVKAHSYRNNKDVQFVGLIEETMNTLADALSREFASPVSAEPGLSIVSVKADSCWQALFNKHEATHGVTITHFDAYFDQTDIEVTETESGKERKAFYDIVVDIGYSLRGLDDERFDTIISVRKPHSSRNVVSGLLAAGPSIVENQDDALEGVHANVELYMRCFFPGSDVRKRFLYVTKEFENVGDAFNSMDYSDALAVCEKLADSSDAKIAAKANYNCAVLLERMGDYEKVKPYLQESLRLQPGFVDAQVMLQDYHFQ